MVSMAIALLQVRYALSKPKRRALTAFSTLLDEQIATAPMMIDSTPGKEDNGPVYDIVDEERAPLAGNEEDGEGSARLCDLAAH